MAQPERSCEIVLSYGTLKVGRRNGDDRMESMVERWTGTAFEQAEHSSSRDARLRADEYSYAARIDALRATKVRHTREKQAVIGSMDFDDHAIVLPSAENRRIVELMGPSGVPITDVLLANYVAESNHPSGSFFGAAVIGRNFRKILELHEPYIDPMSSLAG